MSQIIFALFFIVSFDSSLTVGPVHCHFNQRFLVYFLGKCTDKERLSVENCVFYGTYSLFKCPRAYNPDGTWSKQMFDATTKKCVDKQKIAVPTDCQAYKECVSIEPSLSMEYWREASCPTSMHFNPSTATCVMSNESDCCKYLLKSRTLTQHIGKGCKQSPCLNGGTCFYIYLFFYSLGHIWEFESKTCKAN